MGKAIPEKFAEANLTCEDLLELTALYDVGFFHSNKTADVENDNRAFLALWLDDLGGRFTQR